MKQIFVFGVILIIFKVASGSNDQSDNDNLDEALYLTEYIENGDIETVIFQAQKLASVSHPEMAIESYAGYLTVNKEYNSNLFFWFFPAKIDPDDAPVVLWLQGGPGAPSMFSVYAENGPYKLQFATGELLPNEYSWHLNHNLLYIDNPVGTGYSFTEFENGYSNNQTEVANNLLIALQQFFVMFPKLQKNDFYATGVSYGGKYVSAIAYAIHRYNRRKSVDSQKPKINLRGLVIDSGWVDPLHQSKSANFFYEMGYIDSDGYSQLKEEQNRATDCIKSRDFECAYNAVDQAFFGKYFPYGTLFYNLTGIQTGDGDVTPLFEFLIKSETRHAIHVGNNTFNIPSAKPTKVSDHLKLDFMHSVANWISKLLSHYPVLFYNGQSDFLCSFRSSQNFLKHLNFDGAEEYKTAKRRIWRVDDQVTGYVKQAKNLTEVLVLNAGHTVVAFQPKPVLDLLLRFTHHERNFL